jgi:thymidylate synthase
MIKMNTVKDIRKYFMTALAYEEFVPDKTGVKTIEMIGAQFVADEPAIFGTVDEDYVKRELEWYRSMSLNVNDIPGGPPKIWQQVASKNGTINSNYGWCVWSSYNGYQYDSCYRELRQNPNSRRGIMIYTRPDMQTEYNADGMSDFMCTNTVQYLIRNGELYALVNMRSNDVVYGYKNDYAWQAYVQQSLAADLGCEVGPIIWNVGSLHVYERHFGLVK